MMDAAPLYPHPWHPGDSNVKRDWSGKTKPSTRTRHPVKYVFIDFGLSRRYTADQCPPSEAIIEGGIKTAPEFFSGQMRCDPFPTDVWYLGDMIQTEFIEVSRCFSIIPAQTG